jgi:hypothetical protein
MKQRAGELIHVDVSVRSLPPGARMMPIRSRPSCSPKTYSASSMSFDVHRTCVDPPAAELVQEEISKDVRKSGHRPEVPLRLVDKHLGSVNDARCVEDVATIGDVVDFVVHVQLIPVAGARGRT